MADLFTTIQNVRSLFEGLSRDVDPEDKQDQTKDNTRGLAVNFDEIATVMQSMEAEDVQDLMKEYGDIFSGRESLMKNIQDINEIIDRVRSRAEKNAPVKQKVEKSLTGSVRGSDFEGFLSGYKNILGKLLNSVDKKARKAA